MRGHLLFCPILDIMHGIYSFVPIYIKIGPFSPNIGPHDLHGSILWLDNICLYRPDMAMMVDIVSKI